MRTLLSLLLAFTMATSQALAFENGPNPVGKIYFSVPFGGPARAQMMPRVGFRIDRSHGPSFTHPGVGTPASLLDWRLDFNGQTNLRLNGVDIGKLQRALHAADGGGWDAGDWAALGLGIVLAGGLAFTVFRWCEFLSCEDNVEPPM